MRKRKKRGAPQERGLGSSQKKAFFRGVSGMQEGGQVTTPLYSDSNPHDGGELDTGRRIPTFTGSCLTRSSCIAHYATKEGWAKMKLLMKNAPK